MWKKLNPSCHVPLMTSLCLQKTHREICFAIYLTEAKLKIAKKFQGLTVLQIQA